jgi:hypothetical protein|tara:strand:- start:257 stop:538 length:282 start_codon:yes stop_codon:yes gene_type:complete
MNKWITEKQIKKGRVEAEKFYKEFLQDESGDEQTWNEIEIDGQYFDIECFDDDMEKPRTETTCAIYPVYLTNNGLRECDGTKYIRLFTNEEEA